MSVRRISSRVVYENPWLRVREDEIERPGGERGVYALVDREDFAVVVAWDGERIALVEQFRYTLGRVTLELPQGVVDGASPEEAARTELAEETGLRAGALRHLGRLDGAVGSSNQGFHVWLATDLTAGPPAPEPEEVGMATRFARPEELDALVRSGAVTDASSVAAWALVRLHGGLP